MANLHQEFLNAAQTSSDDKGAFRDIIESGNPSWAWLRQPFQAQGRWDISRGGQKTQTRLHYAIWNNCLPEIYWHLKRIGKEPTPDIIADGQLNPVLWLLAVSHRQEQIDLVYELANQWRVEINKALIFSPDPEYPQRANRYLGHFSMYGLEKNVLSRTNEQLTKQDLLTVDIRGRCLMSGYSLWGNRVLEILRKENTRFTGEELLNHHANLVDGEEYTTWTPMASLAYSAQDCLKEHEKEKTRSLLCDFLAEDEEFSEEHFQQMLKGTNQKFMYRLLRSDVWKDREAELMRLMHTIPPSSRPDSVRRRLLSESVDWVHHAAVDNDAAGTLHL